MQYLGIDYGRARIGLAASGTGRIARPIGYIKNKGDKKNAEALRRVLAENNIDTRYCCIMCGVPLSVDGGDTRMSREVLRFGGFLGDALGLKVVYHNERYSSVEAEEYIREKMGVTRPEKIKELVDGAAAAVILQDYLENIGGNK
jgi:putative Holliday junction resolvase